ncbi:MAG: PDDEXK nuclease domain-containing protein [Paludibacteraceae bacterium]|nr:PDDEXK nuclease domain-containing protein [Paludibacteraceae bacterium]
MKPEINFNNLVQQIEHTNEALQNNARLVINRHVTAKAWLTGYYIVEYEQNGSDRAQYGEQLLQKLAERLGKGISYRTLKLYRLFYMTYSTLAIPVKEFIVKTLPIGQSVIAQLEDADNLNITIGQSLIAQFNSKPPVSQFNGVNPDLLFNRLSFTHLAAILPCKDPLQRAFYETMAIRGTWSVRELQRQIDSNYYERSGWSQKPMALADMVDGKAEHSSLALDIKSPFTFEFLGLTAKDVVEESDLETALIDHLQDFILELGMGFCFEERQKKLLIDDRYFKADLVFYHRILKRHVIVELKANRLDYADTAQLKMYLAYYRKNIMMPDDNPPIGILMCSEVGQEMAEYTLLDIDENVFVSKYELSIPSKECMTDFLRKENEGLR